MESGEFFGGLLNVGAQIVNGKVKYDQYNFQHKTSTNLTSNINITAFRQRRSMFMSYTNFITLGKIGNQYIEKIHCNAKVFKGIHFWSNSEHLDIETYYGSNGRRPTINVEENTTGNDIYLKDGTSLTEYLDNTTENGNNYVDKKDSEFKNDLENIVKDSNENKKKLHHDDMKGRVFDRINPFLPQSCTRKLSDNQIYINNAHNQHNITPLSISLSNTTNNNLINKFQEEDEQLEILINNRVEEVYKHNLIMHLCEHRGDWADKLSKCSIEELEEKAHDKIDRYLYKKYANGTLQNIDNIINIISCILCMYNFLWTNL